MLGVETRTGRSLRANPLSPSFHSYNTLLCLDFRFARVADTSSVDLGAVLIQIVDGVENIVASRALADPEKKYSVIEHV